MRVFELRCRGTRKARVEIIPCRIVETFVVFIVHRRRPMTNWYRT